MNLYKFCRRYYNKKFSIPKKWEELAKIKHPEIIANPRRFKMPQLYLELQLPKERFFKSILGKIPCWLGHHKPCIVSFISSKERYLFACKRCFKLLGKVTFSCVYTEKEKKDHFDLTKWSFFQIDNSLKFNYIHII